MIVAGIPAYNEEKTVAKVVLLAQKHVDKVIVCDDGSTDLTADIAEGLGALVIRNEKNKGYGAALKQLFGKAIELNADVLLTLDADSQHNPEEIPRILEPLKDGKADIAIGSRFLGEGRNQIPAYRRFGIKMITGMTNGNREAKISDAQSGFRAYNRKAINSLELLENGMGISAEILMRARDKNLKITEIPANIEYEGLETSTHNAWRHGLNVVTTILRLVVEERPLVYLGVPGTLLFLSGLGCGIYFWWGYTMPPGRFLSNYLFAALALILFGSLILVTAVNLFAIIRLSERQRARRDS